MSGPKAAVMEERMMRRRGPRIAVPTEEDMVVIPWKPD